MSARRSLDAMSATDRESLLYWIARRYPSLIADMLAGWTEDQQSRIRELRAARDRLRASGTR